LIKKFYWDPFGITTDIFDAGNIQHWAHCDFSSFHLVKVPSLRKIAVSPRHDTLT